MSQGMMCMAASCFQLVFEKFFRERMRPKLQTPSGTQVLLSKASPTSDTSTQDPSMVLYCKLAVGEAHGM